MHLAEKESSVWIHQGIIQKQLLYQVVKRGAYSQQVSGSSSKGKHFKAYLGCEITLFRKIFLRFKKIC